MTNSNNQKIAQLEREVVDAYQSAIANRCTPFAVISENDNQFTVHNSQFTIEEVEHEH